MNVTEQGLREYIEAFNSTLRETGEQYIPSELQGNLFHLSLLPARIVGYISTQFGTAIEWHPAAHTRIETNRGSARVEDLLVQAPPYLRARGPMLLIAGVNTAVKSLTLEGGFPFRLGSRDASVFIQDVRFRAGQWSRSVTYAELLGDRRAETWSREKAVTRAKDEVLAALSDLKQSEEQDVSVVDYISTFKKRTVLLLGDYDSEGLLRLSEIAALLQGLNYEPLLIKDVPDIPTYSLPQKLVAIGAVARFVVIDDSSKSGHLTEVEICKNNDWVTILLRAGGQGGLG
jgi:hypothetical protein